MGKVVRDVQPPAPGAKDWQPSAFNPKTGVLYIPHPVQLLSADELAGRADAVFPDVLAALTAGPVAE